MARGQRWCRGSRGQASLWWSQGPKTWWGWDCPAGSPCVGHCPCLSVQADTIPLSFGSGCPHGPFLL